MNWIKKHWKQLMILVLVVMVLTFAVMGWHWTDTAERPGWYNAWPVIAIISLLVWVGAWAYFWTRDKGK